METEPDYLPSQKEVEKVFKDFKQALKVVRYQTPLQRANYIATRTRSIAFEQKVQSQVERVFNLLKPGHNTVYNVDLMRTLKTAQWSVALRIPVTLLSEGDGAVLLKTNEQGYVAARHFPDAAKGVQSFLEEVGKTLAARPYLPRFVHKHRGEPCTFHSDADSAVAAWTAAAHSDHRLQQYVQPHSKSTSLLRVLWRDAKTAVYYSITHGPSAGKGLPSLATKTNIINRSFSEPFLLESRARIKNSTSNLIIQRLNPIPEVSHALDTCVKLLNSTLRVDQRVVEMVCDFTPDLRHEWVCLGCEGFTFQSRLRELTATIKQNEVMNLQCLMFPLVTRKSVVYSRLHWSNKLKSIAQRQRVDFVSVAEDTHECVMPQQVDYSAMESPIEENCVGTADRPRVKKKVIVESLLRRDVSTYDKMVQEYRAYKEENSSKVNIIEKHGGLDVWKRKLREFMAIMEKTSELSDLYNENIGVEESDMIICGLLRVVRGGYNFYYKEALRRVHCRMSISAAKYALFLSLIRGVLMEITQNEVDSMIVLRRLEQLKPFICQESSV